MHDGEIIHSAVRESSFDPLQLAGKLIKDLKYDAVTATGYGRHLISRHLGCPVISEISAFAAGGSYLFPSVRTLLDIGGQDTKAVSVDENGRLLKFDMNDKCAAGTGRFLEIMAAALGFRLNEFGDEALKAERTVTINSMCTVFAESEIISMVNRGGKPAEIARGIHESITRRSAAILKKVGVHSDVLFGGGVALNSCVRRFLSDILSLELRVPSEPQIVSALGCALSAEKNGGRQAVRPIKSL